MFKQFRKQLVAFLSDLIEFGSVNHHIGIIDIDHPWHGNYKGINH